VIDTKLIHHAEIDLQRWSIFPPRTSRSADTVAILRFSNHRTLPHQPSFSQPILWNLTEFLARSKKELKTVPRNFDFSPLIRRAKHTERPPKCLLAATALSARNWPG